MKTIYMLAAAWLILGTFLLSNCAALTGYQDGRTLGKENASFSISLNQSQSPDFEDLDDDLADSLNLGVPTLLFPNLEFGGSYGVSDKVDVAVRLNTNLNFAFGGKVQVVGDHESPFAMALGAELGTFGFLVSGLWNVQLPLFLSVHPSEKFTLYLTPRFIYQAATFSNFENGITYVGTNAGLLFGKRNKFGIDIGYFSAGGESNRIDLVSYGLGGRFLLRGGRK